jgi:hypothetical protein
MASCTLLAHVDLTWLHICSTSSTVKASLWLLSLAYSCTSCFRQRRNCSGRRACAGGVTLH